jgi:AraC family transcriptional regulator
VYGHHQTTCDMSLRRDPQQVSIIEFPETKIAVFQHRGDPAGIGESVRRFIEWRREHGLTPDRSATFNILHDDPATTPPDAYRLDLGASLPDGFDAGCGILSRTIPSGRCAVLRHLGNDDTLGESIRYLVAEWFPASGEMRRNFPLFLQRVQFPPRVPDAESIVDIFLPLA